MSWELKTHTHTLDLQLKSCLLSATIWSLLWTFETHHPSILWFKQMWNERELSRMLQLGVYLEISQVCWWNIFSSSTCCHIQLVAKPSPFPWQCVKHDDFFVLIVSPSLHVCVYSVCMFACVCVCFCNVLIGIYWSRVCAVWQLRYRIHTDYLWKHGWKKRVTELTARWAGRHTHAHTHTHSRAPFTHAQWFWFSQDSVCMYDHKCLYFLTGSNPAVLQVLN